MRIRVPLFLCLYILLPAMVRAAAPFGIHVIDSETGRGVPLIELRTTNETSCFTDSNGYVAFDEDGLLGGKVYFLVRGDGYEYPADGFGYRGVNLDAIPGEEAEISVSRTMIAECLYRITGAGIYRDSILLGKSVPLAEPLLNARVMGQDSAQAIIYRGRIRWFWGDTGKPDYPLGNFATSGACSLLPADGGLDPSLGVDLHYFVDRAGFSRAMVGIPQKGAKWIDGLMVLPDDTGRERLVGYCARMKSLEENLGNDLIFYDDDRDEFVSLMEWPVGKNLRPLGQPFRVREGEKEYFEFPTPFPLLRVEADWDAVRAPERYEGYTCLEPGASYDAASPSIERDADGKPVWGWKAATEPLLAKMQEEMVTKGFLQQEECTTRTVDAATSETVLLWAGSTAWNAYRQRYILIGQQMFGKPSNLGEIWYAESKTPEGPWTRAVKIATHQHHTLYNPVHHPFFDAEGGRIIHFEGTYSDLFADKAIPTPRYHYNQIMYRLDLADPRLQPAQQ